VRDLPHQVVEAFKSTLEEIADADLLVHLVDASDAEPDHQIASVRTVLNEIGAHEVDEIIVFNKTDAINGTVLSRLTATHPDAMFISARTGAGTSELLDRIVVGLAAKTVELDLEIPYGRGDLLAELHSSGEVLDTAHNDTGTTVTVRLPHDEAARFRAFVT
jgi:GTP-binding protein HflX